MNNKNGGKLISFSKSKEQSQSMQLQKKDGNFNEASSVSDKNEKGYQAYYPRVNKVSTKSSPNNNTPWKNSIGNKYAACVEGKGEEALSEGIATIYLKDIITDEKWYFQLIEDSNTRQNSPKNLEWYDDENMLVVFGYGYGTLSLGGDLYLFNINTNKFTAVYDIKDKKNQIISVQKSGENLLLFMEIYDDESWSKHHKEQWMIHSFSLKLKEPMNVTNSNGEIIDTIMPIINNK
jgi:hypothetical protein